MDPSGRIGLAQWKVHDGRIFSQLGQLAGEDQVEIEDRTRRSDADRCARVGWMTTGVEPTRAEFKTTAFTKFATEAKNHAIGSAR